jgi:riboflavin kinase/FMN adenylyltransferase
VEVVFDPDSCTPPDVGSAVTIGAYDGVHLGHQRLLAELRAMGEARGLVTTVVTFDRHPATVVRPGSAPLLLTDLPQKLELLGAAGVGRTLVVPFDEQRAAESAEDFVREVLVGRLRARLVVVGENFHFGHRRRGDVGLLEQMGGEYGFDVVGLRLEADREQEETVSSTRIRALVASGDVVGARRLLGRPHTVRGRVARGDGRGGAKLGFPTANLQVPSGMAIPADGIYACRYERSDGSILAAAVSIGRRPTFYEAGDRVLEAHILDFDGDLYGEQARLWFVERLRDDRRFESSEALVAQMEADVTQAREILAADGS